MSENKQAVDNTETGSETPAEEVVAQEDDLDSLLNEFDKETDQGSEQTEKKEETLSDEDRAMLQEIRDEKQRSALKKEIERVKSYLPEDMKISDRVVHGLVEIMAVDDPRIASAYAQRGNKPGEWDRVLKGIAKDIQKEFDLPDKAATETHDAIVSAVRSASTTSPPPEQRFDEKTLNNMSDEEFNKAKQEMLQN